jgi:nitrogen regulatory protein PII
MSRISKIEVITGMSKLTDLIQQLSKVGIRGVTVMQVLGCGVEMGTQEYEVDIRIIRETACWHRQAVL